RSGVSLQSGTSSDWRGALPRSSHEASGYEKTCFFIIVVAVRPSIPGNWCSDDFNGCMASTGIVLRSVQLRGSLPLQAARRTAWNGIAVRDLRLRALLDDPRWP